MKIFGCVVLLQESRGKRPFKLWDGRRSVRKGLVVGSLEELVQRGRDKLGVSIGEPVRLVLESDGTQVEDAEYFRTLPANTILLLLRPGERWLPAGVDVIRAGKLDLYAPHTDIHIRHPTHPHVFNSFHRLLLVPSRQFVP